MGKLLRIAYCSRSSVTGSRAEIEMQTRKILATARTNNREARVTGAMAFNEDCFAQVLEGSPGVLAPLFERIRRDPRHRDVKILAQTQPMRRLFPQWSMAYVDTPDGDGRHPLSHFSFEAALTAGAEPEAMQLLEAMCQLCGR
jgi:Sensors of blue-light using FAD